MNSKVNVEYDFDKKEPYIQLYAEGPSQNQPDDMRDGAIKNLIEEGARNGFVLVWPDENSDNKRPQIRISHSANLKWVGLNAKCLKDINSNFQVGKSYNLLMATGDDHHVYAKGSGHIVRTGDDMEFEYLAEFVKAWEINDIGRFDVSKQS